MDASFRPCLALLTGAFLLVPPSYAFITPLSSEAVREAYFLGQRHDGSYPRLLEKYTKFLPPPKTGPYISSIAFFTPFIQLVRHSDQYVGNYSAQQAQLDHRDEGQEIVQIFVEIKLTQSYGGLIPASADSRPKSPPSLALRPHDFWKDFHVSIFDADEELMPGASHGHANFSCGRDGPCILTGATLEFELPATAFTSDTAIIDVTPPEGERISVDFDLSSLR